MRRSERRRKNQGQARQGTVKNPKKNQLTSLMKNSLIVGLKIALFIVMAATPRTGSSHNLNWSTCQGGGGSCAGGRFKLICSVGQPDAGTASGGTFVQQGGFLPAFQKSVLPSLTVTRAAGEFILSWPDVAAGVHADWSQDLQGNTWYDLGEGAVVGTLRQVRIPAIGGSLFFRLRKDCPR